MKLDRMRRSQNIEDRRGQSGGGFGGGFPGGGLPGGGLGGRGGGGVPVRGGFGLLVIVVLVLLFGGGGGLSGLMGPGDGASQMSPDGYRSAATGVTPDGSLNATEAQRADLVSAVLGSTEDFWTGYFRQQGMEYPLPKMVLFRGQTRSACGAASQASGPFYCPADQAIYLDLAFFDDMERKLGARGDFAQAYVIAHEVGHHVQEATGLLGEANQAMARNRGERAGEDSIAVRIELQADCLAGIWAAGTVARDGSLEAGDIEEAIGAAEAVGDDRLQQRAQGFDVPDSFTHGTSEQRARWFMTGMRATSPSQCDTFKAQEL
ncbi:MAG: neutral zinc metallopeptidase [Hyphomonadaceae bacterium]|nr:neutral zinc metallopeptidase [Hyphomonadaceae bacterium]